ncbi:MAG: quinone-dependent dihydroorotate dehydrogenase, partial [Bacteroidales bacterium]|nr:quinone-dependent dihydroorotate dehydrogenase [Bacteroidales bacterium]
MYKRLFRPLFFLFSAEQAHHLVTSGLRFARCIPGSEWLFHALFDVKHPSLERDLWGLHFKNPVGLAAGFDKNATYIEELSLLGFSFIETGTVTPKAQPGNPKPRLFRLKKDKALINRMGFNNHGAEKAKSSLQKQSHSQCVIGGNIGKNTATPNHKAPEDYGMVFRTLYDQV